ncbi:MAG: hypothetical protein J3K34DRAFT_462692 [Monoraphidium minutum]|nr:MAG: hypothetical protein J3K34DRAFT_462692 [Monoraphidium minutum]
MARAFQTRQRPAVRCAPWSGRLARARAAHAVCLAALLLAADALAQFPDPGEQQPGGAQQPWLPLEQQQPQQQQEEQQQQQEQQPIGGVGPAGLDGLLPRGQLPPQPPITEVASIRRDIDLAARGERVAGRVVSGPAGAELARAAMPPGALSGAAARGGFRSADDLLATLRVDASLKLDLVYGTLHYACADAGPGSGPEGTGPRALAMTQSAILSSSGGGAEGASLLPPPPPLEDAFKLHSRPSARLSVLLNFNGTFRNFTSTCLGAVSGPPIRETPYDIDGDNTTFSDEERRRIIAAWQGVVEDYTGFDLDITTDPELGPGQVRGKSVAIGGSSKDWYDFSFWYSGVACRNNFNGNDMPAFVFANNIFDGETRATAAAAKPGRMAIVISHELGHTFNLDHHGFLGGGDPSGNYYECPEGGLWGPIMGAPFRCAVTQWSDGKYVNASLPQDDIKIIKQAIEKSQGVNNAFVPDDHGSTKETADLLPWQNITAAGGGLVVLGEVGRELDTDFFKFWAAIGSLAVRLDLLGYPLSENVTIGDGWEYRGSNLNTLLTLHRPNGNITTWASNGTALLTGAWSVALAEAGYYYVSVQGAAMGDVFTAYGSMGRYALRLAGDWQAPFLNCSGAVEVFLPIPQFGCNQSVALDPSALYTSNVDVTATPLLPAAFPPGHDVTYTFTPAPDAPGGVAPCATRVAVVDCVPSPVCLWDSGSAVPLPDASGSCNGTVINTPQLYSGPVTSVAPPLPDGNLFRPGSNSYTVSGPGGNCTFNVTVLPCGPPTCREVNVTLPGDSGSCNGTVINTAQLYSGPVTSVAPPLPPGNLFGPGSISYTVSGPGGNCTLNVTVLPCAPPTCGDLNVTLPQPGGTCVGAAIAESSLYTGGPSAVDPPITGLVPPGTRSYNVSNVEGSCTANITVLNCTIVTCASATVQLPGANGSCNGTFIDTDQLFSGAVASVAPPLPPGNHFGPGSTNYTVSSLENNCTFTVTVLPCGAPPTCRAVTVALPQPGGTCAGAAVNESSLYTGEPSAVDPPITGLVPPGTRSYNVSNAAGSCTANVTVLPCTGITCNSKTVPLPQRELPAPSCSFAFIPASSLYTGVGVLVTPRLPEGDLHPVGETRYSAASADFPACFFTVSVKACQPLVCKNVVRRLADANEASCLGTNIPESDLYSGGGVSITVSGFNTFQPPGTRSYVVSDAVSNCTSNVSVEPCEPVACASGLLPLPQSGGMCGFAEILPFQLYAGTRATVTPALPANGRYPPGSYTYEVSNDISRCRVAIQVAPCPPPLCRAARKALPIGGRCDGAPVTAADLAEGPEITLAPPLAPNQLYRPGRYVFNATNPSGSCIASLNVVSCELTCTSYTGANAIQLPLPGGDCSGAVLPDSAVFNSNGDAVTFSPTRPDKFPIGTNTYIVSTTYRSCNFTVSVDQSPLSLQARPPASPRPSQIVSSTKVATWRGWRQRVTLQVADGAGAQLGGIQLEAAWTHAPVSLKRGPIFSYKKQRKVSSKSAKNLGLVTLISPRRVPLGDELVLNVLFLKDPKNTACDFHRPTTDAERLFACRKLGC